MNIGKNLNFSQLKNIFSGIFFGRLVFWIAISMGFLSLIILSFIYIYPLSNQYRISHKALEDLFVVLEKYALKKNIYNNTWIESKKSEKDLYEEEIGKCRSFFKGRDDLLETLFVVGDTEKGFTKIEDEALWKNEYVKRTSALLAKIRTHNIAISEGVLPFQSWGYDIPVWDTILPVQKNFWIIEALVHVATNTTGITRIKEIRFREVSSSHDPSFAHLYTVVPVTLTVELRADCIEFLLYEILKSDIPFVIEGISIVSTDKNLNPDPPGEDEDILIQDANHSVSYPVIGVTIDAYVIDYKT